MGEGEGGYVWSSSDQDLGAPKKSLKKVRLHRKRESPHHVSDVGAQRQTKAEISGLVLTSRSDQLDFAHDFGLLCLRNRSGQTTETGVRFPSPAFSSKSP
jgi:hypothetical protein